MDLGQLISASKGVSSIWQIIGSVFLMIITSTIALEVAPIKLNPLKYIGNWLSRGFKSWFADVIDDSLDKQLSQIKEEDKKRDEAIVKMDGAIENLNDKIDQITDRIDTNEQRAQANHIAAIRRSILGFGNQIRGGMDASKESYDDIIEQYDEYAEYIKANKLENGKMDLTIKFIRDRYDELFNHVPENKS